MTLYKQKIGLIGGFGAYATLDFYRRILEVFASDCERNYPHIVMDNNFTMPSRTKALLCGADYDKIVADIANSMELMLHNNVDKIILVCGTAHYFLKDVYKMIPEAQEKVVDIIDAIGEELSRQQKKDVLIIAAEGTLLQELYPQKLNKYHINCINPSEEYYKEIRSYIEAVKQNKYDKQICQCFIRFLKNFTTKNVILGCTEFPVLLKFIKANCSDSERNILERYTFYDPLEVVLNELKATLI